jgi:hypothetical protein
MIGMTRWLFSAAAIALLAGTAFCDEPAPVLLDVPPPRDCPLAVACGARPVNTPHYDGYYVGGGAVRRGDDRGPLDGTWGWDYSGCCYGRRVMLGWWHGRRYQGGTGAYKESGPHLGNRVPSHPDGECSRD